MMQAVAADQVDVVLAWHPDRLHRSPVELEQFIDTVEAHGVRVETVQAGRYDLATPSGRFMARTLGNGARYESEHKSERVRRALEQNAAKGARHGRRAYGWQSAYDADSGRRRDVIDPAEAAVVRRIADQIIAGESLRNVTKMLNDDGVPSPTGKPWAKGMVRHVVLRERNAGLRVHRGQVVGDGAWQPILDRGRYEQAVAVLGDPRRRTSTGSAAVHLLSGLARCGVCGGPMRASMNRTVASYRCAERACVSRNRRDVDALVTAVVVGRLALPDAVALLNPDRTAERARAAETARGLRARLDTAGDEYADGKIEASTLSRITERLRPQITAAEQAARTVDDAPLLEELAGNARAGEVWAGLALSQRRAVVDALVQVRVLRAKPGARTFDPATVEITWR